MKIAPVRTATECDTALREISLLTDATVGTPRGDRLDVLVTLVAACEEKHWRIDPPEPLDALVIRMKERGLTRRDLEGIFRSSGRVSEILNRKRSLSLEMMQRLHAELGIPAESFMRARKGSSSSDVQ
ncbi:MAG: transcriptional regulator [Gemmatimonadaceae bacterium]